MERAAVKRQMQLSSPLQDVSNSHEQTEKSLPRVVLITCSAPCCLMPKNSNGLADELISQQTVRGVDS